MLPDVGSKQCINIWFSFLTLVSLEWVSVDENAIFSVCFFMLFLLNHEIKAERSQTLILFCDVQFSILYMMLLDFISSALENSGPIATEVLSQLSLYQILFNASKEPPIMVHICFRV
jgi:hypothetical protein